MLPPVIVQAKPEAKDIFAYKMYHSFWCFLGVMRLLVSAAFLSAALLTIGKVETYLTVALFGFGILNPVITPGWYWIQAVSAAGSCVATTYTFTEKKIRLNDGKKQAELAWESLALTVWLKKELFLYTAPAQALVLPRRQMEKEAEQLLEMIRRSSTPGRTVIREWL